MWHNIFSTCGFSMCHFWYVLCLSTFPCHTQCILWSYICSLSRLQSSLIWCSGIWYMGIHAHLIFLLEALLCWWRQLTEIWHHLLKYMLSYPRIILTLIGMKTWHLTCNLWCYQKVWQKFFHRTCWRCWCSLYIWREILYWGLAARFIPHGSKDGRRGSARTNT
jgi:hypothetical protein